MFFRIHLLRLASTHRCWSHSVPRTSGTRPRLLPCQRGLIGWCWECCCPLLSLAFDSSQLPRINHRFLFHRKIFGFWSKIRWNVWKWCWFYKYLETKVILVKNQCFLSKKKRWIVWNKMFLQAFSVDFCGKNCFFEAKLWFRVFGWR